MRDIKVYSVISSVVLFLIVSQVLILEANTQSNQLQISFDYAEVVSRLNMENIKAHSKCLSSLGSRYTTYPGYGKAAEYIYNELNKSVDKVWFSPYNGTFYVDYGANLTAEGGVFIPLYPLLPNGISPVTTPREGLSGKLIYVDDGDIEDFNGKNLNGSIVVMKFNSRNSWLDVAKFGAKAVIFLEPEFTIRNEAMMKRLYEVSFKFPRLYVESQYINLLFSLEGKIVNIKSITKWENRLAKNVVGYIEGKSYRKEAIMISSYFDSCSIVPSVSPGASEILGISTMLEIARILSQDRPRVSVLFVTYSGHHQGLVGAREWVEHDLLGGNAQLHIGHDVYIYMDFNLDFNTDTDIVFFFRIGGFYMIYQSAGQIPNFREFNGTTPPAFQAQELFLQIINDVEGDAGAEYGLSDVEFRTTWLGEASAMNNPAWPKWYDHEALQIYQMSGMAVATAHSWYKFLETPIDTFDKLNFGNLKKQLTFAFPLIWVYAYTDLIFYQDPSGRGFYPTPIKSNEGAQDVLGHVVEWDKIKSWYVPVPNAVIMAVRTHSATIGSIPRFTAMIVKADNNGTFLIRGIPGTSIDASGIGRGGGGNAFSIWYAYQLDEEGNVIRGPEMGQYKLPSLARDKLIGEFNIAVFNCSNIIVFDPFNPQALDFETGFPTFFAINEIYSHITPLSYGFQTEYSPYGLGVGIVYGPPSTALEIILQNAYTVKYPLAILTNSTAKMQSGSGFTMEWGQQYVIINTPLRAAEDFYHLTASRTDLLKKTGISTGIEILGQAQEWIIRAKDALRQGNYTYGLAASYKAWDVSRRLYVDIKTYWESSIITVPFFAFLIIPAAFFLERALFSFEGYKRIASLIVLYSILLTMFLFAHPGFTIVANLSTLLISLIILTLSGPLVAIISNRSTGLLKELRTKTLGVHRIETGRGTAFVLSFNYGIGYIRKRRFRSTLVAFSLFLITISLVLFMSMSAEYTVVPVELPNPQLNLREGIVLRRPGYDGTAKLGGVGINVLRTIQYIYGNKITVLPRVWLWPVVRPDNPDAHYKLFSESKFYKIRGIVGLSSQEVLKTTLSASLKNGTWFTSDDAWEIILPEPAAKQLGVNVYDTVSLGGLNFTVVGVYDDEIYEDIVDVDLWPIEIPDITMGGVPMFSELMILVPYKTCMSMAQVFYQTHRPSSYIAALGISFANPKDIVEIGRELYLPLFTYEMYLFQGNRLLQIGRRALVQTIGLSFQLPALIIATLTVLNMMLGSIVERTTDIKTLSSVGLSPLQVAGIFLAEPLVFATIGGIFGYIAAVFTTKLSSLLGFPAAFLNYSSSWAAVSLMFVFAASVGSSLYPIIKASKMVTPSLQRRWEVPTKPAGDNWEIPLPFRIESDREVRGIMSYLYELFSQHAYSTAEEFVVELLNLVRGAEERRKFYALESRLRLTPLELGIQQDVNIRMTESSPGSNYFGTFIIIRRRSGTVSDWTFRNRDFIDIVRKQYLLWKSLKPEQREDYYKRESKFEEIK